MISALLHGIVLGLLLSILIGPVFFMLIKTSIQDGFRDAMILETGIFLSDIFCVIVSYLGLAQLLIKPAYEHWLLIAGGLLLLIFGIVTYLSQKKMADPDAPPKRTPALRLMLKGFFFNISNPSVIFFWIGAVSITVSQYKNNPSEVFFYFSGTLFTVVLIDVMKALLAVKIKKFLTDKRFVLINKIAGIGIFAFGLFLLLKAFI